MIEKRAKRVAWLVFLLAAVAPAATWAEPREGGETPEKPEPKLTTPQADRQVGREEARAVAAEIGLVENAELVAYVDTIGQRLARFAPGYRFDYTFQILDEETPNAFALPGGFVFVSRGLIALSNSESELAGVLAHEIAHVASRHAAARQQVGIGGPQLVEVVQMPFLASYTRDLEHSADRVGQGLVGVAGYDPKGISDLLRGLGALERLRTGTPRIPSFLDTHPGTGERVADTAARAQGVAWTPRAGVAESREDHLRRLEGVVVGPSGAQGVFEGSRFLHPDLDFTLRFPDGWELHNTPRAVGAVAPDRSAQVFFEAGTEGSDSEVAAEEWMAEVRESGLQVRQMSRVRLAGQDAVRLEGGGQGLAVSVTFLPWRDHVYRLVGMTRRPERHAAVFLGVARSFRPLTPELRDEVRETRLRLVSAKEGEGLAELGRRTENAWPLATTAALNGLPVAHRFAGGELLKVGVRESYRPTGTTAAATPASVAPRGDRP